MQPGRGRKAIFLALASFVWGLALPVAGGSVDWERSGAEFGFLPSDVTMTEDGTGVYSYVSHWLFDGELPVYGDLLLVDPTTGKALSLLRVESGDRVDARAGRILVSRVAEFEPPRLEVWDFDGRLLAERGWPDDTYWITDVAIAGSAAVAIVSSSDGTSLVELFDLADLSSIGSLEGLPQLGRFVSVAAAGNTLLVNFEVGRVDGDHDEFERTTVRAYRGLVLIDEATPVRDGSPVRASSVAPAPNGGFYVLNTGDSRHSDSPPVITLHDASGAFVESVWESPGQFRAVGIDTDECLGLAGMAHRSDMTAVRGFKYVPEDPHRRCFLDTLSSPFGDSIAWLGSEGVTRGCNPPLRDRFCPDEPVTRGQLAALLSRALGYHGDGGGGKFADTEGHLFEEDIAKLSAAGVTRGCNPPVNDRFCPDDFVTRGQMAAFLVRALDYQDGGGDDLFTDDDDSIFESDIDKLGTARVTRGCNPPADDRFCPDALVTRAQMAAFLHRARGS